MRLGHEFDNPGKHWNREWNCSKKSSHPTSITVWWTLQLLGLYIFLWSLLIFAKITIRCSYPACFNSLHHAKMKTSILLSSWQWCTNPDDSTDLCACLFGTGFQACQILFSWIKSQSWPNLLLVTHMWMECSIFKTQHKTCWIWVYILSVEFVSWAWIH